MFKDYFKLAWENIIHRRLRSLLTIIGIVIGIATVVALVSLGQGVRQVIVSEFAKIGSDKIFINPGTGWGDNVQGLKPLTEDDLDKITGVSGVAEATGILAQGGRIEFNKGIYFASIWGIPLDDTKKLADESWNVEYEKGRSIKTGDKYKAVIGYDVAYGKAFGKNVGIGDKITIQGVDFDVVGITTSTGDPDRDSSITIPKETLRTLFYADSNLKEESFIIARTEAGSNPSEVAENIKKELRKSRDVKEGEEDFNVQTTDQIIASFDQILGAITGVIIGIAAISIIVGGIGIANTMYTAVLQRTSEIGVMKAIGAKNSQILSIFVIESGLIGMIGGVIGLLLGMALSASIAFLGRAALGSNLLYAYFPAYLLIGALVFAFLLGAVFGLIPAVRASRQKPVDALRYE